MTCSLDVAVFGGGIAGLWTLAALRARGIGAALFETGALGGGQTMASQGIIHGGAKYGRHGAAAGLARALAGMPQRWRDALQGCGPVPLPSAALRAPDHHYCVPGFPGLLTAVAARLTPRPLRAALACAGYRDLRPLAAAEVPAGLRRSGFSGAVLAFGEPVVDVPAVIRHLAATQAGAVFAAGPEAGMSWEHGGETLAAVRLAGGVRVAARHFVFAAGTGLETAAARLGAAARHVRTQRRPLGMAMLRGDLPELYGHIGGLRRRPVASITSHRDAAGRAVWYVGGDVAERAAGRRDGAPAAAARAAIAAHLPAVRLAGLRSAVLHIDRAEPAHGGRIPDGPVAVPVGNVTLAWPVKLAFAPALAEGIVDRLGAELAAAPGAGVRLPDLPPAPLAAPPWETAAWS